MKIVIVFSSLLCHIDLYLTEMASQTKEKNMWELILSTRNYQLVLYSSANRSVFNNTK